MISVLLKGMIIGIANIIPGVSGGTMAVVFGIYDAIIYHIAHLTKHWRQSLHFLLPLGIGGLLGIIIFSKLIKYLLASHYQVTNFFFVGLIIGTCPLIWRKASQSTVPLSCFVPFIIAFLVVMISDSFLLPEEGRQLITQLSPSTFMFLLISGIIGASTMIIPGVSGSFVLLLMGAYSSILTAIADFNIPLLIPVAIGIVIGILATSKIIHFLLNTAPQPTYMAILGFMLASIFSIYPGFPFDLNGVLCLIALLFGGVIAFKMQ